jgi:hypothetical protein
MRVGRRHGWIEGDGTRGGTSGPSFLPLNPSSFPLLSVPGCPFPDQRFQQCRLFLTRSSTTPFPRGVDHEQCLV